jgi:hypothetical protein
VAVDPDVEANCVAAVDPVRVPTLARDADATVDVERVDEAPLAVGSEVATDDPAGDEQPPAIEAIALKANHRAVLEQRMGRIPQKRHGRVPAQRTPRKAARITLTRLPMDPRIRGIRGTSHGRHW